jgi:hypothetical protein
MGNGVGGEESEGRGSDVSRHQGTTKIQKACSIWGTDSEEEPKEAWLTWVGAITTALSSPSEEREGKNIGAERDAKLMAWSARGMSGRMETTDGPTRGTKLCVGGGEEERGAGDS